MSPLGSLIGIAPLQIQYVVLLLSLFFLRCIRNVALAATIVLLYLNPQSM